MRFSRSKAVELKPRRKKKPLASHGLFVPTMVLWGAALAGLAVFVLPPAAVSRYVPANVLDLLGTQARFGVPAIAAVIGASVMYLVASAMHRAAVGPVDVDEYDQDAPVQAIDPSAELGSDSLDAPLAEDVFADEFEDEFEQVDNLDLGEFANEMPDPSWVEDLSDAAESYAPAYDEPLEASNGPEPQPVAPPESPAPKPATPAYTAPPKSQSAIEKLRAVPPQELSLVQMVERLALALQDNRAANHANANGTMARDTALADALKTLSRFTEDGYAPAEAPASSPAIEPEEDVTEAEMRRALARLQSLRGAA